MLYACKTLKSYDKHFVSPKTAYLANPVYSSSSLKSRSEDTQTHMPTGLRLMKDNRTGGDREDAPSKEGNSYSLSSVDFSPLRNMGSRL